ncbi:hypothetical protein [Methanomethylophilus alvi]|uniref:hypothetical protein n=1 Tax=Methanomethylophilus alvi TaxID=1291540 RepID=UPI0037DC09E7
METLDNDDPYLSEMLNMLSVTSDETRSGMSGYLQMGLSFCKSRGMVDGGTLPKDVLLALDGSGHNHGR